MHDDEPLSVNQALQILSLGSSADAEEIQTAWRKAVRLTHPDRNPASDPTVARHRFNQVQEAYRVLSDPAVVKQRQLARASAPLPPFTGDQFEAFLALGLGPGSTYDEINLRSAVLLRQGADSGVVKDAHALLTNPQLQAQKILGEANNSSKERSRDWYEEDARRAAVAGRSSGMRSILYAFVALILTITAAVLIKTPRLPISVSIFTALMAVACFLAALREASRYSG